jgi:hypothetical protein
MLGVEHLLPGRAKGHLRVVSSPSYIYDSGPNRSDTVCPNQFTTTTEQLSGTRTVTDQQPQVSASFQVLISSATFLALLCVLCVNALHAGHRPAGFTESRVLFLSQYPTQARALAREKQAERQKKVNGESENPKAYAIGLWFIFPFSLFPFPFSPFPFVSAGRNA